MSIKDMVVNQTVVNQWRELREECNNLKKTFERLQRLMAQIEANTDLQTTASAKEKAFIKFVKDSLKMYADIQAEEAKADT